MMKIANEATELRRFEMIGPTKDRFKLEHLIARKRLSREDLTLILTTMRLTGAEK